MKRPFGDEYVLALKLCNLARLRPSAVRRARGIVVLELTPRPATFS